MITLLVASLGGTISRGDIAMSQWKQKQAFSETVLYLGEGAPAMTVDWLVFDSRYQRGGRRTRKFC